LINPTTRRYTTNVSIQAQAPLGLLSLAAVLRSAGHNVKIFDRNVEDGSIKKYLKFEPELVGLTSFTGPMLLDAIYLSSIFRKHLDVPIVWGGIHASLLPQQTIENPNIDIVVVGEGEETILELADCIEQGQDLENVQGIYWKKQKNGTHKIVQNAPRPFIRNLDSLPFPTWDLLDKQKYFKTSLGWNRSSFAFFSIQSSRGCPYNCGFCYNTVFNKRKWRPKSPERVVEEIAFLKETYRAKTILFVDDNFAVSPKRAMKISQGIVKNKLDVNFHIDCRVDLLSKQVAKFLRVAGCDQIYFGIESGSPRILRFINKGITLKQALHAVRLCRKLGIMSSTSFIMGFPTETIEDIAYTCRFIYQLNPDSLLLKFFVPYPGSPLYNYVIKHNLFSPPAKLEDWAITWTNIGCQFSKIPPDTLRKLSRRTFRKYFTRRIPKFALIFLLNLLKKKISPKQMLSWGIKNFLM